MNEKTRNAIKQEVFKEVSLRMIWTLSQELNNLSLWCDELGGSSSGKAPASAKALRREAVWGAQELKRKHECLGCGMWGKGDGGGQKGIPSQDQGHGGVGISISLQQEAIGGL